MGRREARPETDPGILANRVALGYAMLAAIFGLDQWTPDQRERWAVDHGLLAPRSGRARRRLAELWSERFR